MYPVGSHPAANLRPGNKAVKGERPLPGDLTARPDRCKLAES
jgi:hypothetical protein